MSCSVPQPTTGDCMMRKQQTTRFRDAIAYSCSVFDGADTKNAFQIQPLSLIMQGKGCFVFIILKSYNTINKNLFKHNIKTVISIKYHNANTQTFTKTLNYKMVKKD